ncbi:MAG: hypothetical protein HYY30_13020 [Chloroflexi bacterium]|nr:hypothetical protein [Chloroflexota bacterium]
MALARGEVDFEVNTDAGAQQKEADGLMVPLFIVSREKSDVIPKAPTMFELGATVPKELETAHAFISTLGYSTALPPEVPQDRVDYLRKALDKISGNTDMQKDVAKVMDLWTPFVPGKVLQDRMVALKTAI